MQHKPFLQGLSWLHTDPENDSVTHPLHAHTPCICVRCLNWIWRIKTDSLCFAPDKHNPYQTVTHKTPHTVLGGKGEEKGR